jgi:aconitate hydratase 2/2-methylisocitrate dehydratase
MGNQARVADKATVFSTSTRNFDNRMGRDARVYLGSAELAAVCAKLGRMPSHAEYMEIIGTKLSDTANIYKYLNFDQMTEYKAALETLRDGKVKKVIPIAELAE